jgi:hypothetical protein
MKILETYPSNSVGHVCFICHNARRKLDLDTYERIVNTKREAQPGRGLVMICETCILEAANKFGCLDKKTSEAMSKAIDVLQGDLAAAQVRIKELEALNDAFNLVASINKPSEA